MQKNFQELMSLLHKLWCAYILFFKLRCNFHIWFPKLKFPILFPFTNAECYFVAKCYFKFHGNCIGKGAIPHCTAHLIQWRERL